MTSGANQDTLDFVQNCHYQMLQLLDSLDGRSNISGPSRSPYTGGEYLISYNINPLLICLDPADTPIGSPQISEGELADSDSDGMVIDGDGQ